MFKSKYKYNPDNRTYIKFSIKNKDLLSKIQRLIQKDLSIYNPQLIKRKNLHLTLFHYGKPKDLFKEIIKINTKLKREDFSSCFTNLIISSKEIVSQQNKKVSANILGISKIRPMSSMLDIFGPGNYRVVVLRLNEPKEIAKTRELLMKEMVVFLNRCGIEKPVEFMKDSENLKWQVDYNPHVSIAVIEETSAILPKYDLSGFQILLSKIIFVD